MLLSGVDMEPKSVMDLAIIPMDPVDTGMGSSDKGNAIPSVKQRKKTMTSVYLKFFETAPDGKSRKCKFCGQSYSIATATGNFSLHTLVKLYASDCAHYSYYLGLITFYAYNV